MIHEFDILSPKITLFFQGINHHINKCSLLLSFVSYLLITVFSIPILIEYFAKSTPRAYSFKKINDNNVTYELSPSLLFHFISSDIPIDYNTMTIIGISNQSDIIFNLSQIEHWEYGPCDNIDIKEDKFLLQYQDKFSNGVCIKRVWNVEKQIYYDSNDTNNFYYPYIQSAIIKNNFTKYKIIIFNCNNSTLLYGKDYNYSEQKRTNKNFHISLYFIDNLINLKDYSNPIKKYFNQIENDDTNNNIQINNIINISPAIIKTHNDFIFSKVKEDNTYIFDRRESFYTINNSNEVLCSFYFSIGNIVQIYERDYIKIYDVLSLIGGISKIIITLFISFNKFINLYSLLRDSSTLFKEKFPNEAKGRNTKVHFKLPLADLAENQLKDSTSGKILNNLEHPNSINQSIIINKELQIAKSSLVKDKNKLLHRNILNVIDISVWEFIIDLFKCCKTNFRKKKYQILLNFRSLYLSEEFLCDIYILKDKDMLGPKPQIKYSNVSNRSNFKKSMALVFSRTKASNQN